MTEETRRREIIIDCLHNWKISFQVTGNQALIDKSINILVGENQRELEWFQYSQIDEFVNIEECERLGFDAKNELNELLKLKNNQNDSWDNIRKKVFKRFADQTFPSKLNAITGEVNGSEKRNKLIMFIKQCENSYLISQNEMFIQLAKNAKKVVFQVNDWIQSRAYDEIGVINNPTTGEISNNFIKLIAEPKIETVILPPSYIIEEKDNVDKNSFKIWYLKYGLLMHICIFCFCSIIYWLIFGWDSFLLLVFILATLLANLLLAIWFSFFYREKNR